MEIEQFWKQNRKRHIVTIERALKYNKYLAEDIVADAYMKAMETKSQFNPKKGTMNAWFNRILFNTLKDYQRKYGYTVSIDGDLFLTPQSLEFLVLLDRELEEVDNQKHKHVIRLFYGNGYTSNEISELVGLTKTNITTICNRFRDRMREKYGLSI